jgi:hypothetical protein
MSASALRYAPAADRNGALRTRTVALAHQHRRYGVGMIYLKLRQAGERVDYKRVERLYVAECLQVRPSRPRDAHVVVGSTDPAWWSGSTRTMPRATCGCHSKR